VNSDIEGADKQQYILPFSKRKGQQSRDNRGIGDDGRLIYKEFMWRIDGRAIPLTEPLPVLGWPSYTRSIHDAAKDLMSHGLGGGLNPRDIDPSIQSKQLKMSGTTEYVALINKCAARLRDLRLTGEHEAIIKPRLSRIADIVSCIKSLRHEATEAAFVKKLEEMKSSDGKNSLQVFTEPTNSAVPTGPQYQEVSLYITFADKDNKAILADNGFTKFQQLIIWVRYLLSWKLPLTETGFDL